MSAGPRAQRQASLISQVTRPRQPLQAPAASSRSSPDSRPRTPPDRTQDTLPPFSPRPRETRHCLPDRFCAAKLALSHATCRHGRYGNGGNLCPRKRKSTSNDAHKATMPFANQVPSAPAQLHRRKAKPSNVPGRSTQMLRSMWSASGIRIAAAPISGAIPNPTISLVTG